VTERTAADGVPDGVPDDALQGGPDDVSELTRRIETALEHLDGQEPAEHPAAYEAMDADIRAALGAGEPA